MRTLTGEGVPNIQTPTTEYPFGRYKNKTTAGTNDGTELSERVLGDMYQGMLNTIIRTGATPNNQPETALISQFADAVELLKPVGVAIIGSDDGGTTYKVLDSITRDPNITFEADFEDASVSQNYFPGIFRIKRNNSIDTTRKYIVTANPASLYTPSVAMAASPCGVAAVHDPVFFANSGDYIYNLVFFFVTALSTSQARVMGRAVLTIYDAGPVS